MPTHDRRRMVSTNTKRPMRQIEGVEDVEDVTMPRVASEDGNTTRRTGETELAGCGRRKQTAFCGPRSLRWFHGR